MLAFYACYFTAFLNCCSYLCLVAIPPLICLSRLFSSRTSFTLLKSWGEIFGRRSVRSLCTVDLLTPNFFAACRTAYRGSVCRNIFSKQHTSFLFGSIHCSHPIKFFCSNLYAVSYLIITWRFFRLYKIIADNQIFLCKMLEITLGMCYNVSVIEILSQNMNETRG